MRLRNIPAYWVWAPYINFLKYGYAAQVLNQFNGGRDFPFQVTSRCLQRPCWHSTCLGQWRGPGCQARRAHHGAVTASGSHDTATSSL